ncbi:dual CXXC motif small (seleno)protein [Thermodesulfobacteriota bacterium]
MHCRSCNAEYSVERFADLMDDLFEEELGNVRCDRL